MPRLKPSEEELLNRSSRAVISYCMEKQSVEFKDLAKYMHCSLSTAQRSKKDPGRITLRELRRMAKALKMTNEQVLELIGL